MKRYSPVYTEGVLSFVLAQSRRIRAILGTKIDQICEAPESVSQFTIRGDRGRVYDGCYVGRFEISYWIDHAEEEVKIIQIQPRGAHR